MLTCVGYRPATMLRVGGVAPARKSDIVISRRSGGSRSFQCEWTNFTDAAVRADRLRGAGSRGSPVPDPGAAAVSQEVSVAPPAQKDFAAPPPTRMPPASHRPPRLRGGWPAGSSALLTTCRAPVPKLCFLCEERYLLSRRRPLPQNARAFCESAQESGACRTARAKNEPRLAVPSCRMANHKHPN